MNNTLLANETYLMDQDFLHKLDLIHNKVIYAKIIALTFDEDPIEEIQGRITTGSVNVDGKSAVRRTCSVTMVANEFNIHEYYWGLNTKFKFYIGVENEIEPSYPKICWFKMGTFLITNFSTSQQLSSYTISIQGKDKMCMLNGEVGGIITPLTWDFGNIETIQDDGSKVIEKYLIKDIITEAVHEHAREPFWNIIVNDLDDLALELLEYRGDTTMYLLYNLDADLVTQFELPTSDEAPLPLGLVATKKVNNKLVEDTSITTYSSPNLKFDPRTTVTFKTADQYTVFWIKDSGNNYVAHQEQDSHGNPINVKTRFSIIKVEYGETIGYRLTDLVYPGDLISNVGESVTSMLDKLINMLGNYEYFYNLDGQFVFQRKPAYYEASWNNIIKKQDADYVHVQKGSSYEQDKMYFYLDGEVMHEYYEYDEDSWDRWLNTNYPNQPSLMYYIENTDNYNDNSLGHERWSYSFTDDMLVTSFSNVPNLLNLRNDYSIWGTRKGVTGTDIPVHLRYAIDVKPKFYKTFDGAVYLTEEALAEYQQVIRDKEYQVEIQKQRAQEHFNEMLENIVDQWQKVQVPDFLSNEDWWDLLDWAELYKTLTGSYPSQELLKYGTEGFKGTLTFPNGVTQNFSNASFGRGQLIIDLDKTTHNLYYGEGGYYRNGRFEHLNVWSPTMHGFSGCYHSYGEFIYLNQNYNVQSVIYRPVIPDSTEYIGDLGDLQNLIDELNAEIERLEEELRSKKLVDWRELIYQMALDYRKHNHDEDFHIQIANNNLDSNGTSYYPKGYTGYEPYYIDLEGFWRTLYDPDYEFSLQPAYVTSASDMSQYYRYQQCTIDTTYNDNTQFYYQNYLGQFLKAKKPLGSARFTANPTSYYIVVSTAGESYSNDIKNSLLGYYQKITDEYNTETHWSIQVTEDPAGLNFWFDFVENQSELDRYAVHYIGDRPKAENDNDVKAIYFRDIPDVIFIDPSTNDATVTYEMQQRPGYEYVRLPKHLESLFSVSRQGKSAMDKLDTFLYNYACCTESITLNTLPVYYLEPNTRIFVNDANSGIQGEYLIDRLSFQLSTNGTMSISATKAIERLY